MLLNIEALARGYMIFMPNHRAPHIWENNLKGRAYNLAGFGPQGIRVSVDDVLSGVDYLIDQGLVDPQRMALYGFSNGAYAVSYLVTYTDRFKCAIAVSGSYYNPFFTRFGYNDEALSKDLFGIEPWDDPQGYATLSPVTRLDHVVTPMLLAMGDLEDYVRIFNSIQLFNGLRSLDRNVTLLRYPDQGHGFTGPALKDFKERALDFIDKHLKN